ncbi:MAG: HAD hydrolase family protein, partial [Planctomycetes bacterium]|nr:HAD hydrolase family protein [Planctomycetota bacterium]
MTHPRFPKDLLQRAADIRLFVTDVDGCWTNGRITVHADGSESAHFDVKDGYGMMAIQKAGIEIAVISGRDNPAVVARAERLGIQTRYMGQMEKAPLIADLLAKRGLEPHQVAAIGDDLPDLDLFARAGFSFAPHDAIPELRDAADWVTATNGGHGAIRECCDFL